MNSSFIECISTFFCGDEIARLQRISKEFYRIMNVPHIWRQQCIRPGLNGRLSLPSTIRITEMTTEQLKSLFVCLRSFSSPIFKFNVLKEGIYQSSIDDRSQGIEKTLDLRRDTFWSSTGSISSWEKSLLVYSLVNGLSVVKAVSITPFRAFYQQGMMCYGPKKARVVVRLFHDDESSDTFRSEWICLDNAPEAFSFPLGTELIIGGVIRIELLGRWSIQPFDQLYYVCLQEVTCVGLPIAAVPNLLFSRLLLEFINTTETGRRMTFKSLCGLISSDATAMRVAIRAELSRRTTLLYCKALIASGRAKEVLAATFPDYTSDWRFRDDIAVAFRAQRPEIRNIYIHLLGKVACPFTEEESICVGELSIHLNRLAIFDHHVSSLRICFSERLGDMFLESAKYGTAMTCYSSAMVRDKVLSTCAILCCHPGIVIYLIVLIRDTVDRPTAVLTIFSILVEYHHPYISCEFVSKSLENHYIDMATVGRMLNHPGIDERQLMARVRNEAASFKSRSEHASSIRPRSRLGPDF